jgi:hypothetical protein
VTPGAPIAGLGCGETQVFEGPGPDALLGLAPNPWALASPSALGIVAYFWGHPPNILVAADRPDSAPTKILWLSHGPGGELAISATPLGESSPVIQFTFPGNLMHASSIELPTPGCWHLDLTIGSARASIDVPVSESPSS